MKKAFFFTILTLSVYLCGFAQSANDANVIGHVVNKYNGEHIPFINITVVGTTIGTASDASGHYFLKNLPEGKFRIKAQAIGYKSQEKDIIIEHNRTKELNFELEDDIVMMDEIVVSADKNETSRKEASIVVNVISPKLYQSTNAQSVSCALNFQPGLRVENDCQNCGFMQVRINGLQGQYTQVMMDSRPILSALGSVYGLEQIPANMVERIEVVRGGSSALFGSNAIAGTVNIITKEANSNFFEVNDNLSLIGGKATDNVTNLNAAIVSEDRRVGAHIFGMLRQRQAFDANDDGFTDIPKLKSSTIGLRSYYKPSIQSKLTLEYHHIGEFRRGGDNIELQPHEAEIAEQTDHDIHGGGLAYTWFTPDYRHKVNAYASMQSITRKSYYGVKHNPDAYGNTTDFTLVGGAQYAYHFNKLLFSPSDLTGGVEFQHNKLHDQMIGYERDMKQEVNIGSFYLQNEWKTSTFGILIGARVDKHNLMENPVISPRVNFRYNPLETLSLRASYSTGFRAPQAFDEDLHISAVGGKSMIITIAPGLKPEYSQSASLSVDFSKMFGKVQFGALVEGFYTYLDDVFILNEVGKDIHGNIIMERTNGAGMRVAGVNVELKAVPWRILEFQLGGTYQKSRYNEPYHWSEDLSAEPVSGMLRSPDVYGYFVANLSPFKRFTAALTGNYTGSMFVEHFSGYIPKDILVETPSFFDLSLKMVYEIPITKTLCFDVSAGIQNIFNSYQSDLDMGAERDSKYIYGPALPRTVFAGIKFDFR